MKLINRLCPLCYSDSFDIVYKEFLPPEGINIIELFNPVLSSERKYNLRIVKCKNCSMVYANPTPAENIPDMVYPFAALRIVSKKKLKQIKEIMKRKAKKK